ncbi:hypothetical protein ES708_20762 [subsurface metagenome]
MLQRLRLRLRLREARFRYIGFYRRIKSRSGPKTSNKATARKIAVLYYRLMKYGYDHVEQGLEEYEKKYKEKMITGTIAGDGFDLHAVNYNETQVITLSFKYKF